MWADVLLVVYVEPSELEATIYIYKYLQQPLKQPAVFSTMRCGCMQQSSFGVFRVHKLRYPLFCERRFIEKVGDYT